MADTNRPKTDTNRPKTDNPGRVKTDRGVKTPEAPRTTPRETPRPGGGS